MTGVGAWLGMPLTFHVFLAASLAAGVYAVVLVVLHHGIAETVVYFQVSWLRLMSLRRDWVPTRGSRTKSSATIAELD